MTVVSVSFGKHGQSEQELQFSKSTKPPSHFGTQQNSMHMQSTLLFTQNGLGDCWHGAEQSSGSCVGSSVPGVSQGGSDHISGVVSGSMHTVEHSQVS